jgi:hypothetical protein
MLSGAVKYDIYLVSDPNGFWHSSGTWLLKRPVVLFEEKEKYVMTDLQLNHLPNLPQRETIIDVASNLWAQPSIIALWVGGSLASGVGDRFSDVDFRVEAIVLQGWQAFLTGEYPSALLLDTEADTGPDAKVD